MQPIVKNCAGIDVKDTGLRWTVPFFLRKNISLRIRNFESGQLKVNDNHSNPVEIASVVVWSVDNTAEALFEVDSYESYVSIQSEAALRNMTTSFPYDLHEGDEVSLRSHPQQVSESLKNEIQQRLQIFMTVFSVTLQHENNTLPQCI